MFDLEEQLRWTPEQVKELIKFYRQFRPQKSEDNLDLEEDNLDLEEEGHGELPRELQVYEDED